MNLYEISRISVSWYEEHLWKISLQTNKRAKSYRVGVYTRQSAPGIFNWLTHICVVPHPVHLNVWRIYASFGKEGVKCIYFSLFYWNELSESYLEQLCVNTFVFRAKQTTTYGKYSILSDTTLTRACKPMTRWFSWLDSDSTRKIFRYVWLKGLVTRLWLEGLATRLDKHESAI